MPISAIKNQLNFYTYRVATILKALKTLYTLPQDKVNSFVNSYKIYDYDWADEQKLIEDFGTDYYNEVKQKIIDWYSVLNHLCAIGQVEKMYIPPAMDLSKGIIANQTLFERRLANDLCLKKGDQALDIGCGRGRIACHVSKVTGAHVTGINIDTNQLQCADRFIKAKGLTKSCEFKQWDLNDLPLPFADASLNGIYHVQVFSYSKNLKKLFKEIHRTLKPGGRFACLDWIQYDAYDPKNPQHVEIMKRIKPLVGAIGNPTIGEYVAAMEEAGLRVLVNENASIDGLQAPLIENADKFYVRAGKLIKALVKCKILPKHFQIIFDRLSEGGQEFVAADRMRLVTSCHYFVAEK